MRNKELPRWILYIPMRLGFQDLKEAARSHGVAVNSMVSVEYPRLVLSPAIGPTPKGAEVIEGRESILDKINSLPETPLLR